MSNPQNTPSAASGRPWRTIMLWLCVALMILLVMQMRGNLSGGRSEYIYDNDLAERLKAHRIKTMNFLVRGENADVSGELVSDGDPVGSPKRYHTRVTKDRVKELRDLAGPDVRIDTLEPSFWAEMVPYFIWIAIFFLLFYFFVLRQLRGGGNGGILSFGKSRAVRFQRDNNPKTFDDVAGIDEAREDIQEIVEFLRNPERFQRLGGRLPKGILLVGGPGTGKTLLAKAIAGEADVPFFSISGSDFVEMYVGVGASRVRDLFAEAKTNAPCIVFIDEIDAIGRRRANDMPGSGMETAQTLNAILVEMDGFTSGDNVIILAATNRPDVLDPALLRPGRFDRRVYVDPPDARGREAILKVHAKGVKVDDDVDFGQVARMTPSFSGADLENLVNEAALIAVMRNLSSVTMACFEEARDKVHFGREKRSRQLDEKERRDTAFHEAGHALLMRHIPHIVPLHKVTIIPRGRALGATMQLPEKDEYSLGRKRIVGQITMMLGGRAAEEMFLDDVTAGAAQDLKTATQYARAMVCEWGMTDALGLPFLGQDDSGDAMFVTARPYSESTAQRIDDEVRRILGDAYEDAKRILRENEEEVTLLVDALLEFEVLDRKDIDALFDTHGLDGIRRLRAAAAVPKPAADAGTDAPLADAVADAAEPAAAANPDTDASRDAASDAPR